MPTAAPANPAQLAISQARVLVVDDEPDLRTLYELTLLREGYAVDSCGTVEEAWGLLNGQGGVAPYHTVITDMRLPDGTGLQLLARMEAAGRPEKGIVITAYGSAENAVEALKAGAYDYLTKPVDLRQFRAVVASALGRTVPAPVPVATAARGGVGKARHSDNGAADAPPALHPALLRLVGDSPPMAQVRSLVLKVARSMAPVLVLGESGTGKELVARAIHDVSPRAAQPFVAVNCGAIPEALLEAEFFGYRKGAFTGANEDRAGFFQAAQGGTLFLDELGDLPLAMQSKLLRVIQERALRPLGTTLEAAIDVRIVSATHKDLASEVQAQRFRQDLYYRLNVIQIGLPPLRERLADLPQVCAAVLARIARDAGVQPVPQLAPAALQHLLRYAFPGNVRELENLLHRALAMAGGALIERDDLGLPAVLLDDAVSAPAPLAAAATEAFAVVAAAPSSTPLVAPPGAPTPSALPAAPAGLEGTATTAAVLPANLAAYLDEVERQILQVALERHRYNRTAAGASLGLSLRQMRYRMARLAIGLDTTMAGGADSDSGH